MIKSSYSFPIHELFKNIIIDYKTNQFKLNKNYENLLPVIILISVTPTVSFSVQRNAASLNKIL